MCFSCMASLWTLFQTVGPSFRLRIGVPSAGPWERQPAFPLGIIPKPMARSSGPTRTWRPLFVVSPLATPASWSTHLPWIEYAHNSLVCSATGMSPFMASNGFQPPLFPSQEADSAVPSVRGHLRRAHRVWREARAALSHTAAQNKRLEDLHRTPAPDWFGCLLGTFHYRPIPRNWLLDTLAHTLLTG